MSLGYGGSARLADSDGSSALYVYKCENINRSDNNPLEDGEIYIELKPIISAYTPTRTKRYPNGVPIHTAENIDLDELRSKGALKITNCSNTSYTSEDGTDIQAITLVWKIALEIQRTGIFPDKVFYFK